MCGIVGIHGEDNVVFDIYEALLMLQHRGQDAAGIVTYDGHFHLKKDNGLVSDVITPDSFNHLTGAIGIGHVRYRTAGNMDPTEAQPFIINSPYGIALIHNGNLTNYNELKHIITEEDNRYLNSSSDSEMLLNVLGHELQTDAERQLAPDVFFGVMKNVYKRLTGSYSVIGLIAGQGMFAFRDPHGIRPLIYGKRQTATGGVEYMIASESVALTSNGFEVVEDIQPGEVIYIDENKKVHKQICAEKIEHRACIFEYVYLARPDSLMDNVSVYKSRLRMGEQLAKKIKDSGIEIDVVIPVPDTARTAAVTLAYALGVKYREGLIKNRYIGRTFIMPVQAERQKSIRRKLNPIPLELKGKKVLIVDDSIVRGNTSRKIVELVREQGAEKVYFASCAPPLKFPCMYGVDMPTKSEFVANNLSVAEIAKSIKADAVFYQDLDDLIESVKPPKSINRKFCTACFDGNYPTPEITEAYLENMAIEKGDKDLKMQLL